MIVTCESCKSRYKLDDAKITGRGAKITCPRCKHIFVVYARVEGDAAAPRAPDLVDTVRAAGADRGQAASGPSIAAPTNWEDDEPTRIGMAQRAPDPPAAAKPSGDGMRPDFNGDERARSSTTFPFGAMAARAAALDFRKVGVTTWKVKVRIGLIYDFSDIKTLRKYIQDGRVTPADVISYDGKAWKPIGDIPDLDEFFVETWERLDAAREAAPADSVPAARVPTSPRVVDEPPKSGGEPGLYADPFAVNRNKKTAARRASGTSAAVAITPPRRPARISAGARNAAITVLVVAVVAAITGLWLNNRPEDAPVAGGEIRTPRVADDAAIRKGLTDKLKGQPADPPQKTPEKPPEAPDARYPGVQPNGVPQGAVPVGPRPGGGSERVAAPGTTRRPEQPKASTPKDHEQVGKDAMRSRDFAMAAAAFQKAADMDPGNTAYHEQLGEARYAAGDPDGAKPAFERAAKGGVRTAYKFLGHIAREQGDASGANAQYTEYLKGSPGDAAEIQRLMNGG